MKKRFAAIISVVLSLTVIFSGCGSKEDNAADAGSVNAEAEKTTKIQYTADDKLVALTFDDGPGTDSTLKILQALKDNDSVATFFTVGYNLDEHPDVTKQAFDMGCEIGNHTKGHKYLTDCSSSEIYEQVNGNNEKIKNITGEDCKLLRAPGGKVSGITQYLSMPLIGWDIDTNDWKYKDATNGNRTEEQRNKDINTLVEGVMSQVSPGDIILMHDIYDFSADAAAVLIPKLVSEGYKLVTVSQLFDAYGETLENGQVYRYAEFDISKNTKKVDPGEYTVATSGNPLNVRQEADADAAIVTAVPDGTVVTVLESVEGWALISYNGCTGWISTAFIKETGQ